MVTPVDLILNLITFTVINHLILLQAMLSFICELAPVLGCCVNLVCTMCVHKDQPHVDIQFHASIFILLTIRIGGR